MKQQLKLLVFILIFARIRGQETLIKDATSVLASSFGVATESLGLFRSFFGGLMPFINEGAIGSFLNSIGVPNGSSINSVGSAVSNTAGGLLRLLIPGFQSLISSITGAINNVNGGSGDDDDGRGGRGGWRGRSGGSGRGGWGGGRGGGGGGGGGRGYGRGGGGWRG